MARVGEAVGELAALVDDHLGDAVADHDAADRQVTRRQALGDRHEVGPDAEVVGTEPVTGAAKTADDLVRHQQDAVTIADPLDLRPVGVRRDDHATGTLDRLADERRDALADPSSRIFSSSARAALRPNSAGLKLAALGVPVRLRDVDDVRDRQSALLVHEAHAAEARAGHRAAVVGVVRG